MLIERALFLHYRLQRSGQWYQTISIERFESALNHRVVTPVRLCPRINHLRLRFFLLLFLFGIQVDIWEFDLLELGPLIPVQIRSRQALLNWLPGTLQCLLLELLLFEQLIFLLLECHLLLLLKFQFLQFKIFLGLLIDHRDHLNDLFRLKVVIRRGTL